MAIKNKKNGYALLVAVVFTAVMLAVGLSMSSVAYKQQILASTAIASQYAFYAADAGLECALFADQKQNLFTYNATVPATIPGPAPSMTCDGTSAQSSTVTSRDAARWVIAQRFSLDSDKRCADVTVYKPNGNGTTYIFSLGYDVPCSMINNNPRFVVRGINVRY